MTTVIIYTFSAKVSDLRVEMVKEEEDRGMEMGLDVSDQSVL